MKHILTKEILEPIVKSSHSIVGVMRKLNMNDSGGNRYTINKKIKEFGIDNKHFNGKHHMQGKKASNRLPWQKVLIFCLTEKLKDDSHRLRRALIESNREYKCDNCGINEWKDKPLILQVHHRNGFNLDHRPINLQFLCPNCHSQTSNFCGSNGWTDIDNVNRYGKYRYDMNKNKSLFLERNLQ